MASVAYTNNIVKKRTVGDTQVSVKIGKQVRKSSITKEKEPKQPRHYVTSGAESK